MLFQYGQEAVEELKHLQFCSSRVGINEHKPPILTSIPVNKTLKTTLFEKFHLSLFYES